MNKSQKSFVVTDAVATKHIHLLRLRNAYISLSLNIYNSIISHTDPTILVIRLCIILSNYDNLFSMGITILSWIFVKNYLLLLN